MDLWILMLMLTMASAEDEKRHLATQVQSFAHLVSSIRSHFFSGCVYLLYSSEDAVFGTNLGLSASRTLRTAQHELALDGVAVAMLDVALTLSSASAITSAQQSRCQRNNPLNVLLSGDESSRKFLQQASLDRSFTRSFWLLFPDGAFSMNSTARSMDDLFIGVDPQFDAKVIVAQAVDKQQDAVLAGTWTWTLWEVYRVSMGTPLQRMMYGTWSAIGGAHAPWPGLEIYARRYDLQGHIFEAVVKEGLGSRIKETKNGTIVPTGFFIEIWHMLEEEGNFSTRYRRVVGDRSGGMDAEGQWSGAIGELQRGAADVAVALMTLSPQRLLVVNFPFPLLRLRFCAFIRAEESTVGWLKVLAPFERALWMAVVGCVVATALCLAVSAVAVNAPTESSSLRPVDVPFLALSVFQMQGGVCEMTHSSPSCRLVLLTAYLTAVVVAASYSATLVASLAVQDVHLPFRSLAELLQDGSYSAGVVDQSMLHDYFKWQRGGVAEAVYTRLMAPDAAANFPPDEASGLARACSTRYAFLSSTVTTRDALRHAPCAVQALPMDLPPAAASIAVARNSSYFELINYNLQRMVNFGVLRRLIQQGLSEEQNIIEPTAVTVTLQDVAPMLAALGVGCGAALLLLLMELLIAANARDFFDTFSSLRNILSLRSFV